MARAAEVTALMDPTLSALGLDKNDVFSVTVGTAGWSAEIVDRDVSRDPERPLWRATKTVSGEFEV